MNFTKALSLLASTTFATAGFAGGFELGPPRIAPLFEEGNYIEFSYGLLSLSVDGEVTTGVPGAPLAETGEVFDAVSIYGGALKYEVNDRWSSALIISEPYGSDVRYDAGPGVTAGSVANIDSTAYTALLKYNFTDRYSVYGGVKVQTVEGSATVPLPRAVPGIGFINADYQFELESDTDAGYIVGLAYENKDLAQRVSVTYYSEITHNAQFREAGTDISPLLAGQPPQRVTNSGDVRITTPQSVELAGQSGVAPNTLVYASVRWIDWSSTSIDPALYRLVTTNPITGKTGGALLAYERDVWTYTLGAGYRFTKNISSFAQVAYEPTTGEENSLLSPTDGFVSYTIGGQYKTDNGWGLGLSIGYVDVGDANNFATEASFEDNDAFVLGVRLSKNF